MRNIFIAFLFGILVLVPAAFATTGDGQTANNALTSAELAAQLSDETGTGVACFATSPTLVTPTLGAAKATSFELEGTTADAFESFIATQDPTADVTVTIPAGAMGVGLSAYGTEAEAPTCAAALKGFIYVASNSTDADDCTMASGTGTAHNGCACDGTNYVDID